MENRVNILKELQEISPILAEIPVVNPYNVSPDYFEGLGELIMEKIRKENSSQAELNIISPLLASISKELPYQVPEDYFNQLPDQAIAGLNAIQFVNEELENLSPLMNDLKGKNTYQVSADYFDGLPQLILNKIKKQPAKVISIHISKRIVRLAAAAIIFGIIAIGSWLYVNRPASTPVASIENKVKQVSEDEMRSFLQNDDASSSETSFINDEIKTSDMKEMLADVSDKELEQFVSDSESKNTLSD